MVACEANMEYQKWLHKNSQIFIRFLYEDKPQIRFSPSGQGPSNLNLGTGGPAPGDINSTYKVYAQ
jgi:hypothetical protein